MITQVNRQPVKNVNDLDRLVRNSKGNATLLLVNRGGRTLFIAIEGK